MNQPTECKYCGCNKFNADSVTMTRFRCGSSYWYNEELWQVANGCAAKCAVQLVELRERIQRAVEVLEGADRWEIITGYESDMERCSNGEWIEHDEAEQAIEILRGNSSKSSDSSPVTADQLATEDYYEAVRQRVPWMTSVQHIEELVDGYRQCGLMVWKAAKHIEDLFGGKR